MNVLHIKKFYAVKPNNLQILGKKSKNSLGVYACLLKILRYGFKQKSENE